MNRRELLQSGTMGVAGGFCMLGSNVAARPVGQLPDRLALRIQALDLTIAPGIVVPTLGCNNGLTGPLINVRPNHDVSIELINEASGRIQMLGTGIGQDLNLNTGDSARTDFKINDSSFMCPQVTMCDDPVKSLRGIAGMFVPPDAAHVTGQSHRLTIHHWIPSKTASSGARLGPGICYRYATLGANLLSASEPIRVHEGELVRFQFFNASPTQCVSLRLPGHRFLILALDGYPVPRPREVKHLTLSPGDRAEAVVAMCRPGRYVLGSVDRRDQDAGFGRIIEYANASGTLVHPAIEQPSWDYRSFGGTISSTAMDLSTLPIAVTAQPKKRSGFHRLAVDSGRRYRLRVVNTTGLRTRLAIQGHKFQLTSYAGSAVPPLTKDTITVPPFARTELDFVASESTVYLSHGANVGITS